MSNVTVDVDDDLRPGTTVVDSLDVIIDGEDEFWSDYFVELENQYMDLLKDDEEEDYELENAIPECANDLSVPIFDGSLTTVGMSLYSILSYAVKNSLR